MGRRKHECLRSAILRLHAGHLLPSCRNSVSALAEEGNSVPEKGRRGPLLENLLQLCASLRISLRAAGLSVRVVLMYGVENPRSLRSRLLTGAAALIMVPVLYALSSGPAAYLATWNDVLIPPVEKLYLPLILAADRASLLPLLERYVNWWEALHSK